MLRKLASIVRGTPDKKKTYRQESYSQCGEDLIIDHVFHELRMVQPGYIDIGAHHPRYINNTYLFYLKGSRGINIEPDPQLFEEFTRMRNGDINLNVGVGDTNGEADFYIMTEPTLNTFIKEEAERAEKEHAAYRIKEVRKLKINLLDDIIRQYNNGNFPELLSIDVEGLDEVILRSINYETATPKVMCVETLTFSTRGRGEKKTDLIEFIKSKGYIAYADTYINTIFVKEDTWLR
ncbi:MAG TPA: FkbM family methyltransferase [Bacteroidia bacterium]|nr:FkbM family methyltransferase [Bacteroidia bacterium]